MKLGTNHSEVRERAKQILSSRGPVSIELGAGRRPGRSRWITIDLNATCDLSWDLRRGIPFPDRSVDVIYSSHFFEHLSYVEIRALLHECKRVLVSKGHFSICVPNARIYIEAYVYGHDVSKFLTYVPANNHTTRIDAVNYMAYMDGHHRYMFDEENLIYLLSSNGFEDARLRSFDPALDLQERDYESIYAEAHT